MADRVDVRKDFRFQVDITTPGADGALAQPAAMAITGILLRLSSSEFGAAIHAAVDNLSATEAAGKAGRFYVTVDSALLVTHVLPLGVGSRFYAIWSKSGDMDKQSVAFVVADGTRVS